jgi:hypothetical protein
MAETYILVRDQFGNILTTVRNWHRLEYFRKENTVGYLYLDLDPSQVDPLVFSNLQVDYRLEPWRQVGGNVPYLDGETIFFLRKWGYSIDSQGRERFRLECRDPLYILEGHNCAYSDDDGMATISSLPAEDAIKTIVDEQMGAAAIDTTRDLTTYMTIEAVGLTPAGPTVTEYQYSRRQILSVLQDLADYSLENGTYLIFDIVYVTATLLQFRTYQSQRGVNHGSDSGDIVAISRERKNLEEPELMEDHTDEWTYIYAGGHGDGESQIVKTATNTTELGLSPFNRREKWISSNASTDNAVQADADLGLMTYRPKNVLSGKIIDVPGCLDGIHYRWGDRVYAEYRGKGFNAHLNTMHVTIEEGKETRENHFVSEIPAAVTLTAGTPWYLKGGIPAANCIVVYQPKWATDLADSYINLANPGTYNAAPGVAPTFNTSYGWLFDGATKYLDTGYAVPDGNSTVLVQFSDVTTGCLIGIFTSGTQRLELFPIVGATSAYSNGGFGALGTAYSSGNIGVAGQTGYKNGVSDGTFDGWVGGAGATLYIGARNNSGADVFTDAKIQKVVIYNIILTPVQVLAVSTAMAKL